MLLAFRFLMLVVFAAAAHFQDGLAYAALAVGMLLGWRGMRFYWLAAPVLALAVFASQVYAHATSEGKISGAMGNLLFETIVFAVLGLAGYLAGYLLRQRRVGRQPGEKSARK